MLADEAADREAIDGINNGYAWKDVHEAWERKTRRVLSPNAFGKYILSFSEGGARKERHTPRAGSSRSPAPAPPSNDQRPPAPPPTSNFTPINAHPPPRSPHFSQPQAAPHDGIDAQRRDISRVERALGHLHTDVQEMRREVDGIRKELQILHTRPSSGRNQMSEAESNTLELLSDTVSNISAKAGEVDGLKFQIEVLRRRLRKLEDGGSVGTPTPSLRQESSFASQGVGPKLAPYTTPQAAAPLVPSGWNAANSAAVKRKSTDDDPHADGKRQRSGPSGTFVHEYGSSVPSTQTLPAVNTMTASPSTYYDAIQPAARYFSTQKDDSQASWRSESERDPNGGRGGFEAGRKSSRPRKSSSGELGTPVWDKETWSGSEVGPDGYYRPMSGAPTSAVSPPSSERGRIVRRGSGGGMQDFGRDAAKRTRQRPIRNSDGILIRKDGKPDQRSISSPMNLKKVHARKMQEAEMTSTGGGSPTSPLVNNDTGDEKDDEASLSPEPEEMERDAHDRHPEIMNKMFPNGVGADARRMNQADYHFSRSDPKEERETDRLETAGVVVKEEPRISIPDSRTTTGPTSAPTVDSATHGSETSSAFSGPPTRRETDQTTPSTANPSEPVSNDHELAHATNGSPHQTSAPSLEEPRVIQETQQSDDRAAPIEPVSMTADQASVSVESSA